MTSIQPKGLEADSAHSAVHIDEMCLVNALRRGDESAFVLLLDRYGTSMLYLAMRYVSNRALAEEVVQETWISLLEGLNQFEGRSSVKTWLFRILIKRCLTRRLHESRYIPLSLLSDFSSESTESTMEVKVPFHSDHPQWSSHGAFSLRSHRYTPEELLLSQELYSYIQKAIEALPSRLREIIILRDVEGWTADEVCRLFGLTETNQRVLLHRARVRVRDVLTRYAEEE